MGTPLFAAPEIMNGVRYDEKVDVYSYGLILMAMAVDVPLLDFISQQWCFAFGKKKAPSQPMRVIGKMTDGSWRPVTTDNPIAHAPPTINSLIIRCCKQDPDERPSFEEILHELTGICKHEIDGRNYTRKTNNALSSISIGLDKLDAKSEAGEYFEDQGVELGLYKSMEASASSRLERRISSENPVRLSSVEVSTII